jgi:hypothetical protein
MKWNGIHNLSPSMGPCWSRDRGYHHPEPMSPIIRDILLWPREISNLKKPPLYVSNPKQRKSKLRSIK